MRPLLLAWVLTGAIATVGAQATGSLEWKAPAQASEEAQASGRPLLLLWQAGPGAPAFTQSVDRLFAPWPIWSAKVVGLVVATRGRSWEDPLPASFPLFPGSAQSSLLALWNPASSEPPTVWSEPPSVLELSRRIAAVSGRALDDPYDVPVLAFEWDGGTLIRRGDGPRWTLTEPTGTSEWTEEGPLGTVLVVREANTGRRAAFPLEGDWSFLYDRDGQSWTPWKAVLVKRR